METLWNNKIMSKTPAGKKENGILLALLDIYMLDIEERTKFFEFCEKGEIIGLLAMNGEEI